MQQRPRPRYRKIERDKFAGKALAVLTSGGDSQGMNATLRAIVRTCVYLGITPYLIKEGYQGLVDGEKFIISADWHSVSSIIERGGTIIGSARCEEFRHRDGRIKAALNLIKNGINNLVVIGGDGTLTGANLLCNEWDGLLEQLVKDEHIKPEHKSNFDKLQVVGIVGSIDNDFVCTEMTIGADSALHRICASIDDIASTAYSHKRIFIIEVMGRHCGYLALKAAICSEADWIFIPEDPPEPDWPDRICNKIMEKRSYGKRYNIIIVAEGAVDKERNPIAALDVKKVITEKLKMDTRVTILGHLQRGGLASAFDRLLGCRMGVEAVFTLMEEPKQPLVISLVRNRLRRYPLMNCVERTLAIAEAEKQRNWDILLDMRGPSFATNLKIYKFLEKHEYHTSDDERNSNLRFAVIHVGTPACGMNAAVRAFTRTCISNGITALAIHDGIDGFISRKVKRMAWKEVSGWVPHGGAFIGAKTTLAEGKFKEIARSIREFRIHALLLVGGFEAYHCCGQLYDQRDRYEEFCIPMLVIPTTMLNNVPGCDYSIGCDSCLNTVVQICDQIRQTGQGIRNSVFIIQTVGGHCGYITTMAGLASGSDSAYIDENPIKIAELTQDVGDMMSKINEGVHRGMILTSDKASKNYTSEFIQQLFAEEGKEVFSCRLNKLGYEQQGTCPSPFDRAQATKFGMEAVFWFQYQLQCNGMMCCGRPNCRTKESASVLGTRNGRLIFSPVEDLIEQTDFQKRKPIDQWWMKFRPYLLLISKHYTAHERENVVYIEVEDDRSCSSCSCKTADKGICRARHMM